jgi:hypothetical protein
MSLDDYALENLADPSTPAGMAMRALLVRDPHRLDRLIDALDDFIVTPLVYADRLSPPNPNPTGNEVYIVPQGSTLWSNPDAAAVVLVEHLRKHISFPEIIADLGLDPPFAPVWHRIRRLANRLAPWNPQTELKVMSGHNRKARDALRDFRKSMEKENALFQESSRVTQNAEGIIQSIRARLRDERIKHGVDQEELAMRIGVSHSQLSLNLKLSAETSACGR